MLFEAISLGCTVNKLNTIDLIYSSRNIPAKHASQVIVVLKHNFSYNLCVNQFAVQYIPTEMGREKKQFSLSLKVLLVDVIFRNYHIIV